jgi:hypothetical protein
VSVASQVQSLDYYHFAMWGVVAQQTYNVKLRLNIYIYIYIHDKNITLKIKSKQKQPLITIFLLASEIIFQHTLIYTF